MLALRYFVFLIITTSFTVPLASAPLYSIGNSLTFDALRRFAGDFDHTINCNQNLDRIFNNPEQTCVPTLEGARPWDDAFATESYDFVTVQPFVGTSLSQDVAAISAWMTLQPDAQFIIHTGWTSAGARESQFNAPLDPGRLSYGPAYFDELIYQLESAFPGRRVASTNIIGTLDDIADDIAAGVSPITSIADFYRDPIHFNATGQYIATQSFNLLTGTPLDLSRFSSVDETTRQYLDVKIAANIIAVPEPGTGSLAVGLAFTLTIRRRRC